MKILLIATLASTVVISATAFASQHPVSESVQTSGICVGQGIGSRCDAAAPQPPKGFTTNDCKAVVQDPQICKPGYSCTKTMDCVKWVDDKSLDSLFESGASKREGMITTNADAVQIIIGN